MKSISTQFLNAIASQSERLRVITLILISFLTVSNLSAATISSTALGGNWSETTTWEGGVVPTALDDVIIVAGATVIIRSPYTLSPLNPALCNSLTINGTLRMGIGSGGSRYLQVSNSIVINADGTLTNDETTLHRIAVGGDFINNGTFHPKLGDGSIQMVFNGAGAQLIGGTLNSQTFENLVIDKTAGQVSVAGNVTSMQVTNFTLSAGEFLAPSVFNLSGNFANNSVNELDFKAGTGTFIFNGSVQSIGGSTHTTFNHVTTAAGTTVTTNRKVTIGGNLLVADGSTLNIGGFDFTVNGTTTIGEGSSGILGFTSTTGTKTFSGHVTISNGGTWSNTIHENIFISGGITNSTAGIFIAGDGTYNFDVNSQSLNGVFTFFDIDIKEGVTLTNTGTITILDSFTGLGTFTQGTDAIVNIKGTSTIAQLNASSAGNTVNYIGGAQNIKGINYVNLGLSGTDAAHIKTLSSATTLISGNLTLSGTTRSYTVNNLTVGGNLTLTDQSNFTLEGDDVTVNGTTTVGVNSLLDFISTLGIKTFKGPVVVNGTWSNPDNESVRLEGGLTNNGTFNAGTGIYNFVINSQSINGTLTIPSIQVESGVALTNTGTLTINSLAGLGSFIQGSNAVLNIGGTSTITSISAVADNNTVNYTGAAQIVYNINYVNLGLSGSGLKTLQSGTTNISGELTLGGTASASTAVNINVLGAMVIGATASFTNNHTTTINGALSGAGTFIQSSNAVLNINGASSLSTMNATASGNTVQYNADEPGIIPGNYFNLHLNQSSGNAALLGNVGVFGTLTLSTGSLDLEDGHLTLESSALLSIASPSASRMIIISGDGELRKKIDALGSFVFPIGEETGTAEFIPVTVEVTAATSFTSAYVGVSVTDAKHPSNNSTTDYLTRYWKISQSGIANCEVSITSSYVAADIEGTEANITTGQLSGVFDKLTNGWKKFSAIGSNMFAITGISVSDTQPSFLTGISGTVTSVSITGGDGPAVCVGTEVPLDATVSGEGSITYVWSPATGLSATDISNPVAQPHGTTTYTLTIYDANGISASDETIITTQQPTVIVNSLTLCEGTSGELQALGADTYEWNPSTGLSATTGSTVTANPTVTTTYRVIGTDANTCTDSAYAVVTVYALPAKPVITITDELTETPKLSSSSATGNQWYKDGVIINGATGQQLSVTEDGSYTVQVTINGCTGLVSDASVIVIVGLEEENIPGKTRIYPNPVIDMIQFDKSGFAPGTDIEVKIYDLMGRVQSSFILSDSENGIDVKNLPSGPHLFKARQNNLLVIQKFIKR